VCLILFIMFGLNPLVRARVADGGTRATGQSTTLDSANLSLLGGSLDLAGLAIANPAGYSTPRFVTMKSCNIKVQTGSLMGSTVIVDEIAIDGLELTLEQNGLKSNLAEVLDVIQKQTSAGSAPPQAGKPSAQSSPPSQAAAPGKQLKISALRLSGTKVHVRAGLEMTLDLGPIELKDPTNPDGRPMKIADVFGKVLINVAQQIAKNPQIPGNLKDSLKNVNKLMGDLPKNLQDMFKKK